MVELVVRLVFSLALVLGLLWLCVRVAGRRFSGRGDALVQVLHRQSISRNAAVTVVSVGQRILVLGATDQQVQVLAELDPGELDPATTTADEATADAGFPADFSAGLPAVLPDPAVDLTGSGGRARVLEPSLHSVPAAESFREMTVVADRPVPLEAVGRRRAEVPAITAPTRHRGSHTRRATSVPRSTDAVVLGLAPTVPGLEPGPVPAVPSAATADPAATTSVAGELLAQLELFEDMAAEAARARADAVSSPTVKAGSKAASKSVNRSGGTAASTPRPGVPAEAQGRLAGSVLAPQTWRTAWGAVTGRAS